MAIYTDRPRNANGDPLPETVWDTDANTKNGVVPTDLADLNHLADLKRRGRRDRREARIRTLLGDIDAESTPNRWTHAVSQQRIERLERLIRDVYRRLEDEDDETT